jgi:outer membrane protein OmpA-like peptidoglycan-associated protein
MVIGKAFFFRRRAGSKTSHVTCRTVILAAVLGLAACNPVETWRDWTGTSKNDPDPETTPNTQNLAAGEASDYPNLATVPPPPVRALTAAERDKLAQSLIADRTNAKYSAEKLAAGFGAMPGAPPPPPPPPVPAPGDDTQTKPDGGAQPAAPAAQPAAAPTTGEAPATAAASGNTAEQTSAAGQGLRKSGEPPEPPPMESSLEVPQVRSTPHPEQVQTASPPPYPTPAPTAANAPPQTAANTPPQTAANAPAPTAANAPAPTAANAPAPTAANTPPQTAANTPPPTPRIETPLAPVPLPAALGSTAYQAPPPPLVLAPLAPAKASPKPPPPPPGAPVAEIKFAADSTTLSQDDRQTLDKVAALYQQNPGRVRIVGYAGAGSGAAEQLNSFRAALDRAQAVAAALKEAGIPSDKIAVEAAPSDASAVESRAEVLLEH